MNKYYISLDTLKILVFWEITRTNNVFLLDRKYSPEKQYSEEQEKELTLLWDRLYEEYWLLRNDNTAKRKLGTKVDIKVVELKSIELKNNYDFLVRINNLSHILPKETIDSYEQKIYKRLTLIEPKFKPKYFEGIAVNLKLLEKFINAFENKINQLKANFKEKVEESVQNVYKTVANAEFILNRQINVNKMVVSHWIAIEEQVNTIYKANQNGKG